MTNKKYFFPALLAGIFIILVLLTLPKGYFFGSHTDWLSQHVRLAETIRNACVTQKTLVPDLLPLGGGSNGYQFSYYGYLRPDVLVGCLFPSVSMVYFVIGYMLAGYFCSVMLCYYWLCGHTKNKASAFAGSLLFLTAACFFQAHRQIMFINYMPFLFLALLCIRKKRFSLVPLCMLLIYLNSFYYSIACLAVIGWYWFRQDMSGFWKKGVFSYIKTTLMSISMAALLLIPTALVILEHRRPSDKLSMLELWGSNSDMHALLYSPYGMGLTAVCLYLLLLGLMHKKYRLDSIMLLFISYCSIAAWILNGTLYARAKILIPFVPLIVLQCTRLLNELRKKSLKWKLWPCLFILPFVYLKHGQRNFMWIVSDALILLFVILLNQLKCTGILEKSRYILSQILLCVMPCLLFFQTMLREDFVKKDEIFHSQPALEKIKNKPSPLYRCDSLSNALNTANLVLDNGMPKSAMYSSIYSQGYSDFYYNTLLTPVQINNRLAILPSANPFMLNFLGVRYVETAPQNVPQGYKVLSKVKAPATAPVYRDGDTHVLSQNENVLPVAYVTSSTMSEAQFLNLDTYGRLDAITRYTVVPDTGSDSRTSSVQSLAETGSVSYEPFGSGSQIKKYTPELTADVLPDTIQYKKSGKGFLLNVKKKVTVSLKLKQPLVNQILMLDFDIHNKSNHSIVMDINGIRNKLSGPGAPYPNENSTFHYQFSGKNGVDSLNITFPKGKYLLENIQWHTYDSRLLHEKQYTPIKDPAAGKNVLISGQAKAGKDGYFVTSFPVQKGIEVWIDGKRAPLLTVNQTFAGAKLSQGTHSIKVIFHAPGKKAGMILTIAGFLIYLLYLMYPKLVSVRRKSK